MAHRAPIVNDVFIEARKQEAGRAGQQRAAVKSTDKPAGARRAELTAAPIPPRPERKPASPARPVTAAVTPTLTIAVDRGPALPTDRSLMPTAVVKPAVKKAAPSKRKIKQLQGPRPGFLSSLWKFTFGMLMGINIAVSVLFAGLLIYGSATGDLWKWFPFK